MNMKEALDRLRRYNEQSKLTSHLDALDAVYPGTEFGYALSAYTTDLHEAADELLRLTDPTPIDRAWIQWQLGLPIIDEGKGRWRCDIGDKVLLRDHETLLRDSTDYIEIPHITTRGELRSLAQLLKIELKEQP